jgi:hypothetical protein
MNPFPLLMKSSSERQVAVGHHHDAVELREILRRQEREVQILRVVLEALDGRDLESTRLAHFGDGPFRRPEAGVLVESRVGQEQELASRRRAVGTALTGRRLLAVRR